MISVGGGKTFVIRAPLTTSNRKYVIGAKLNSKPIDRAWITHDELVKGGILELVMDDSPAGWAKNGADPVVAVTVNIARKKL